MSSDSNRGIVTVLAAAVLWGTTGTAQSFAPLTLSPYLVGALRLAIAALFFIVVLLSSTGPRRSDLPNSVWRHLPWLWIVLAGIAMAAYNLMFFAGVKAGGVAVGTAVAIGSSPVWAGALQFATTGKTPLFVWWCGTVMAVSGGCLLVFGPGQQLHFDALGIALCLGAGLSYAVYALINKRLVSQASPLVVTAGGFAVAALLAMPAAAVLSDGMVPSTSGWLVVGYLGVVATGVAYLLFSSGLRFITGVTGVTLALAEPLTAFLLAIVVVGEQPDALAYAGLTLLLAGLALVIRSELRGQA